MSASKTQYLQDWTEREAARSDLKRRYALDSVDAKGAKDVAVDIDADVHWELLRRQWAEDCSKRQRVARLVKAVEPLNMDEMFPIWKKYLETEDTVKKLALLQALQVDEINKKRTARIHEEQEVTYSLV